MPSHGDSRARADVGSPIGSPRVAPPRSSTARDRLLATAARIFYAEGITSVGVDRLVSEAGITRATFYRHYPGKEDLVLGYLRMRDDEARERVRAAAASGAPPREVLVSLAAGLGDEVCGPGFRGCPFINAAAEYPDPAHPVRQLIAEHRAWFRGSLVELLRADGQAAPELVAGVLVVLRDGAMAGGYLDDPQLTRTALVHAIERLLG
jgi:AcrR family transcriptional regulator